MPTGVQQALSGLLCVFCQDIVSEDNVDSNVCIECSDELLRECEICGDCGYNDDEISFDSYRRIQQNNIMLNYPAMTFHYSEDSFYLCSNCVFSCGNCNSSWSDSYDASHCCSSNPNIMDYSYRPSFLFYDATEGFVDIHNRPISGKLYMGVELEVVRMANLMDEFVVDMSGPSRDFVYAKHDGSLDETGVEIVSMPATIDAFRRVFPFGALDNARNRGARSFYYESCGFHIHVSRSAFSATHMWRFIKFQLMNPGFCQFIAQRPESQYASWYFDASERSSVPDYVKGKKSNGRRYLAINFQNADTVELRYFKGNILRAAIMKNLEFVQSMYDYTKDMSIATVMGGGLKEEAYKSWLNDTDGYENLKYFMEHNQTNKEN